MPTLLLSLLGTFLTGELLELLAVGSILFP